MLSLHPSYRLTGAPTRVVAGLPQIPPLPRQLQETQHTQCAELCIGSGLALFQLAV